jgi:hypothetical protein
MNIANGNTMRHKADILNKKEEVWIKWHAHIDFLSREAFNKHGGVEMRTLRSLVGQERRPYSGPEYQHT